MRGPRNAGGGGGHFIAGCSEMGHGEPLGAPGEVGSSCVEGPQSHWPLQSWKLQPSCHQHVRNCTLSRHLTGVSHLPRGNSSGDELRCQSKPANSHHGDEQRPEAGASSLLDAACVLDLSRVRWPGRVGRELELMPAAPAFCSLLRALESVTSRPGCSHESLATKPPPHSAPLFCAPSPSDGSF